jgi:hypothetical protein
MEQKEENPNELKEVKNIPYSWKTNQRIDAGNGDFIEKDKFPVKQTKEGAAFITDKKIEVIFDLNSLNNSGYFDKVSEEDLPISAKSLIQAHLSSKRMEGESFEDFKNRRALMQRITDEYLKRKKRYDIPKGFLETAPEGLSDKPVRIPLGHKIQPYTPKKEPSSSSIRVTPLKKEKMGRFLMSLPSTTLVGAIISKGKDRFKVLEYSKEKKLFYVTKF